MEVAQLWDCAAWKAEGLPLSTTSNEACKMYDATLQQYVGWFNDASLGGLDGSVSRLTFADPDFVMGEVLASGLELMGTGKALTDPGLRASLERLASLVARPGATLSEREREHARAVQLLGDGCMLEACRVWERILDAHPTDVLALKFANDAYFYLGKREQIMDSVSRVLPRNVGSRHYGNLLGMHAFGLEENNLFDLAEKAAKQALQMNDRDGWATHALAHVYEMTAASDKGSALMSQTESRWQTCDLLACHNYWHWALYCVDKHAGVLESDPTTFTMKGDYEEALTIYDTKVFPRCKESAMMLDVVDACSMLYRLTLEGIAVGDRWSDLAAFTSPHVGDHTLVFNDVHLLMSTLGAKETSLTDRLLAAVEARRGDARDQDRVAARVGVDLCRAQVAFDAGSYGKCVDLLRELRYDIPCMGGSNAQRDVFNLLLVRAAILSQDPEHKRLARSLLAERHAVKPGSCMTQRQLQAAHAP